MQLTEARVFPHRHLLSVEQLTKNDANLILDTAETFFALSSRPEAKVSHLRGTTVINLFYEASTRTRTSFEIAGKRLSADVINISQSHSSAQKGENLLDTCRTLEAMHPSIVVLRHKASGAPHFVAKNTKFAVINAGDGMHAHPTQALLDAFTIRRALGKLEGLRVAICGDVMHSRVARSLSQLLNLYGNEVHIAAPPTLTPTHPSCFGAEIHHRIEDALIGADVIVLLRIQNERIQGSFLPSLQEYSRFFCLNPDRLKLAKPEAFVMHPGPMNRGVEIDPRIADGDRSLVLNQVEAGVAIRMALLYLLAGKRQAARRQKAGRG